MFMSDVQPAMNLTTANQSPMPPKPNREVRFRPLIAMRRRVVIESSRACRSGLRPKHLQLKQNTCCAFNIYRCLSGPQWSKLSERFEATTITISRRDIAKVHRRRWRDGCGCAAHQLIVSAMFAPSGLCCVVFSATVNCIESRRAHYATCKLLRVVMRQST